SPATSTRWDSCSAKPLKACPTTFGRIELGLFENPGSAASPFRRARQAPERRFPRPRDRASPYLHLPPCASPLLAGARPLYHGAKPLKPIFPQNRGSFVAAALNALLYTPTLVGAARTTSAAHRTDSSTRQRCCL